MKFKNKTFALYIVVCVFLFERFDLLFYNDDDEILFDVKIKIFKNKSRRRKNEKKKTYEICYKT